MPIWVLQQFVYYDIPLMVTWRDKPYAILVCRWDGGSLPHVAPYGDTSQHLQPVGRF